MEGEIVARIDAYGNPTPALRCPDCDAPLLGAYEESHTRGLELILSCAADCGYSRKQLSTDVQGAEDDGGAS